MTMPRARQVSGGGRRVEVSPTRLPGWLNRFGATHGGIVSIEGAPESTLVRGADGASAELLVPFGPMKQASAEATRPEPVEALLAHLEDLGDIAMILVRERAYSIGVSRDGAVITSSTDTRYVQSRTAAGGWSQQRYARRRGNQRRDSYRAAADTAHRVLTDFRPSVAALVVGGDRAAITAVLADRRLAWLQSLPRRSFADIAEPRRAVLDDVAARARCVDIIVRDAAATSDR